MCATDLVLVNTTPGILPPVYTLKLSQWWFSDDPVAIQCAWNFDPRVHWNATGCIRDVERSKDRYNKITSVMFLIRYSFHSIDICSQLETDVTRPIVVLPQCFISAQYKCNRNVFVFLYIFTHWSLFIIQKYLQNVHLNPLDLKSSSLLWYNFPGGYARTPPLSYAQ